MGVNDFVQLLNQIQQLMGSPLDRQLEYVIQTFTSVVCPPVAAGSDVVAQEVYDPVADVRSQLVGHLQCQQLGTQAVNGALLLLVCVSFTIIGQPRNSVLIRRV